VLTAAHCVFDIHGTRKIVSAIDFSPGMNGAGHPFGVHNWQTVRVLQQFTNEARPPRGRVIFTEKHKHVAAQADCPIRGVVSARCAAIHGRLPVAAPHGLFVAV